MAVVGALYTGEGIGTLYPYRPSLCTCGHDVTLHGSTSGCLGCTAANPADAHVFTATGSQYPTAGQNQGGG